MWAEKIVGPGFADEVDSLFLTTRNSCTCEAGTLPTNWPQIFLFYFMNGQNQMLLRAESHSWGERATLLARGQASARCGPLTHAAWPARCGPPAHAATNRSGLLLARVLLSLVVWCTAAAGSGLPATAGICLCISRGSYVHVPVSCLLTSEVVFLILKFNNFL